MPDSTEVRSAIRELLAAKEGEWDAEGDEWLYRASPDDAELSVDYLTDALVRLFDELARG